MDFDPGTSQATSELGQQFTDALLDADIADVQQNFSQLFSLALAIEEIEKQEGAA